VTASGFSGATAVNFGSLAATSFSVTSATTLTAVSPAVAGASAVVEPKWEVRRFKRPYLITPPKGNMPRQSFGSRAFVLFNGWMPANGMCARSTPNGATLPLGMWPF